ncbi:flavodoxin family protein [Gordonia oryzae]|uniref:Flavodoxin family protein n=1 Tax=Gordonia oryzae TaxID=2487349 RepID=A0A3N4GVB8_9ACTN|nr:flavodoxin family protein [Gordonia oryzae]RPA66295.1 flavodoxin family protein [Gordonia oryzae]
MVPANPDAVGAPQPRVLLLYYSYTGQTRAILTAAGDVFAAHGYAVDEAAIEFTDDRYARRFTRFPMARVWPDMLSVLPAQVRKKTGSICVPDFVTERRYDLVCIGSPTWWSAPAMPMRSFLASPAARQVLAGTAFAVFVVCRDSWRRNLREVRAQGRWQGGRYLGSLVTTYPGGQLRSMLSLTSFLGSGEYRKRYLGVPIPMTNVGPHDLIRARDFAEDICAQLTTAGSA